MTQFIALVVVTSQWPSPIAVQFSCNHRFVFMLIRIHIGGFPYRSCDRQTERVGGGERGKESHLSSPCARRVVLQEPA